ncbi:MAG: RagB/SusD family nutrient uptake outer membrane protein [Prevotellaceae bacterium]|jgi:hypothetical protein|nr:RagB/SusD family nutrient uptake outer membrane protein [Prevotellaceae bacterium]
MKKIFLLCAVAMMATAACNEYLDIVPDQITKVEDLFATKTDALDALAKVYWYLPALDNVNETPYLLGNEYVFARPDVDNNESRLKAQRIMRDLQTSNDPLLGIWESDGAGNGGKRYYVGMRHCDLVLNHVDLVYDMTDVEKREMKAQVKFLKAYYAFMLVKQYGPIVIPQYLETDETDPAKLFPARVTVDESFDYVIALMREAIPDLRVKVPVAEYGQVDQTVAKSILARVLVYRASPFFNGNTDFFSTFKNAEGTPFFPQEYSREKWQDAITALDEAIQLCEANGISLFKYNKPTYYSYDSAFVRYNPAMAQSYYNRRFVVAEPWNTGLIWGRSDFFDYNPASNNVLSNACNIILPDDDEYSGAGMTEAEYAESCDQSLAASYQMLERYYTENGLPIDQDRTYANDDRHAIAYVPKKDDPAYNQKYIGLMQPGDTVIKLLLNREVRFYADLVITGGYSRTHRYRVRTSMFMNEPGGRNNKNPDSYLSSGIGVQKMVHPESSSGHYFTQTRFPYPFIRLADLYLMRAEARNEYLEQPNEQVWEDVNIIRRQYGIRDVQVAWADARCAMTLNKHTTKVGMRDIILQERSIELAFEGIHYWDMVRHNRAITEFSQPIKGWNINGRTPNDFFLLRTIQARRFPRSSYLWPISVGEMNINSNLINNPGWQ